MSIEFSACACPTVGVEWELQLIDPLTLDLIDGILPLMEFFPATNYVKPEYIQSCVELTSCIAENSTEAVAHIQQTLANVLQRCNALEMAVCGAGTHPLCRRLALITPKPRYMQLEKRAGHLVHTQITFSTHVHVGMRSGDEAIHAMSNLIPALPALISLSANSPFWRGHETGHAAYRHRILAAAPNYGLPVAFQDWADFDNFYSISTKAGAIRHFSDIHWDIRPHPDFGTIEIRAMDAASDMRTLHALVAFARALVVCMSRSTREEVSRILPLELPAWIQKENCYRASHLGLDASFIYDKCGEQRPMRGQIETLIDFCEPVAREIGESRGLALVRQVLIEKPGYARQLDAYARSHSTREVVEDLGARLLGSAEYVPVAEKGL
ncbi:MAG: YbdK family carboxylate-amine ligase [Gammaproteobacteria bacterium]|nr:YbdK family carboxylate-amine ligase [Gammaproteobacteria bacterium]MDH5240167.1 YbdK family carboxylate-amine ligase [Gammaproteobacteria bacterium]MDH5261301.1 YbdK family carboxylate-amine ligase [Gammaproteobacteria bacterium]MDH5583395.1 YbdK family carboxylate-amine ligase [Gammaproteobacteria bacterium]